MCARTLGAMLLPLRPRTQEQVGDSIGYKISGDSKVRSGARKLQSSSNRPQKGSVEASCEALFIYFYGDSGPGRTKLVYVTTGYLLQVPCGAPVQAVAGVGE